MRGRFARTRHLVAWLSPLLWLMPAGTLVAQDESTLQPVETARLIRTVANTGYLLQLDEDVLRVAIAEDTVARVQVISSREVLITGLMAGRTTLFVWLADGRRIRYPLQVGIKYGLEFLAEALRDLDRRISYTLSQDGLTLTLRGQVANEETSRLAQQRAEALFLAANPNGQVLNWLAADRGSPADIQLIRLLHEIDPRIEPVRIQVGDQPDHDSDTYILRGRVKNVRSLSQAVTLAERQLGGLGLRVVAVENQPLFGQRGRQEDDFVGGVGVGVGVGIGAENDFGIARSGRRASSGLATQVARGLVITSESGRVISLLDVDEIPQLMVSIRVLEVDRTRAEKLGIDFRLDAEHISFGSFSNPLTLGLPDRRGGPPSITGITGGNLRTSYVDQTLAIAAAIDFLKDHQLARSVAEPNVLTLSGEQASVLVGGSLPIPRTSFNDVTVVQSFQFQEFGIRLDIRPTLDGNNMVALEVSPSIIRPIGGVGDVPGFQIETVNTTARVDAGQSLIFGGLFSFDDQVDEVRVPVLGVLPMFRWKRRSLDQTELLFIITPRVVEPPPSVSEPVELPGLDGIRFPDLDVPRFPDDGQDKFDPGSLSPDGIPPSMRRASEVETPRSPRVRVGNLEGWTVLDEGTISLPSSWSVSEGAVVQSANIHARPLDTDDLARFGTYLAYDGGFDWANYRFALSIRSSDNDAIGAMFRYQDVNNYYRFEWDRQRKLRRLVKRVGGVFELLAEDRVRYKTDRTYEVEIQAQDDSLTVRIDGVTVFSVTDGSLSTGSIALYSWANRGSFFDDVRVDKLSPSLPRPGKIHDDQIIPESGAFELKFEHDFDTYSPGKARHDDCHPTGPPCEPDNVNVASSPTPSGRAARLTAIRREILPDKLRIVLELDHETAFRRGRLDCPPRVYVDLINTSPTKAVRAGSLAFVDDVVQRTRVGVHESRWTRVALDLQGVAGHSIYPEFEPFRIIIDLERDGSVAPGPAVRPDPVAVAIDDSSPRKCIPSAGTVSAPSYPADSMLTEGFEDGAAASYDLSDKLETFGQTHAPETDWVVRSDAPRCGDPEHSVILRTGPSRWAERLVKPVGLNDAGDCLQPGTRVTELASQGGWMHVRIADGREGWIQASHLRPDQRPDR